jgi:hypothetical protein
MERRRPTLKRPREIYNDLESPGSLPVKAEDVMVHIENELNNKDDLLFYN